MLRMELRVEFLRTLCIDGRAIPWTQPLTFRAAEEEVPFENFVDCGPGMDVGLICNANHQAPITITNMESKIRRQLITPHQPAAKFRTNGESARFIVGSLAWFRLNFLACCFQC